MDVKEAIANRFSIRRYVKESVPGDHMATLFRALQPAPSSNNSQNWEFIFWLSHLGEADTVFCYLFPDLMARLGRKLK